jgi:hypothetical protein
VLGAVTGHEKRLLIGGLERKVPIGLVSGLLSVEQSSKFCL